MDMLMEPETVYNSHDDNHIVMSEKVQSLAGSIYQEFERMIGRYDENVVKDLMPLVVNILECLDLAYTENQEHEVELELLREDNEQLVTQYEREKQLRKSAEQRLLEIEDNVEEERKTTQDKVESLESIVRMFELKNKNASDHGSRLEDKVEEMKQEYSRLHDRYTELFKTHVDYMERTKLLLGTDRLDQMPRPNRMVSSSIAMTRSSGPVSYGFSSLDPNKSLTSPVDLSDGDGNTQPVITSIRSELQEASVGPDSAVSHMDRSQVTDDVELMERATETRGGVWGPSALTPDGELTASPDLDDDLANAAAMTRSFTNKEQRTGNTLYQELQFQEPDALGDVDESADITDSGSEAGAEQGSSAPQSRDYGMGKEVENLITENNELLAYKNALNIVKDDLIAKVDELTSDQEILREEIKSVTAVKARQALRIQELEEDIKNLRTEMEGMAQKGQGQEDEDDVPMAQRKRFTRVEMARVLMERNQYKERFMELQEAVRWTEMIRASKGDSEVDKKNKQGIWKFFSNLFSSNNVERPERSLPYGSVRFDNTGQTVAPPATPATAPLEAMRRRTNKTKPNHHDLFDASDMSTAQQQRRATERREQYRAVRAHVRKDDGRVQAYGWSLPASRPSLGAAVPHPSSGGKASTRPGSSVPVPVPVYCRPLMEKEPGMKIWCAAGVNLTGGRTRDGGSIVGASIFYSNAPASPPASPRLTDAANTDDEVHKLETELKDSEAARSEGEKMEARLSSLVWICTSTHSISKVSVIDANNPADILQSFHVCSSHLLCIASVPGAKESDYSCDEEVTAPCTPSHHPASGSNTASPSRSRDHGTGSASNSPSRRITNHTDGPEREEGLAGGASAIGTLTFISCGAGSKTAADAAIDEQAEDCSPVLRRETTTAADPEKELLGPESPPPRRLLKDPRGVIKDGVGEDTDTDGVVGAAVERMSSVLPTMWLGSQSGSLYVHSAARNWKRCLHSIKLKDSVLAIVHMRGRVLAALADGTVAIFLRGGDGQWDLRSHYLLDLGKPHHSIRCMHAVLNSVWCGYRNKIHVIDPLLMTVKHSFDAHPRKESQVRQLAWVGDGVWVSIRLDSTLRLYHAHTHQHLQDVDIEPYVSKMLGTGKLGFSFVRITALLVSSNRLWIGTGNGVIISVPLSEGSHDSEWHSGSSGSAAPGGVVRVYTEAGGGVVSGSFVPFCSMAQAQLSFHGHRDAVKFFVAVPGSGGYSPLTAHRSGGGSDGGSRSESPCHPGGEEETGDGDGSTKQQATPTNMLVISGGEGYIDFRLGEGDDEGGESSAGDTSGAGTAGGTGVKESLSRGDHSHLIVWSVTAPFDG